MPPAAPSSPPVRLRTPAEIVAVVPLLCGFVPHESLVLVSLVGRRSRLGVTVRVDLPEPDPAVEAALVGQLVERLRFDGAAQALAVVCTEAEDEAALPRAALVERLADTLEQAGIRSLDPLLVRAGRWWSYTCRSPRCCPPEGTPVQSHPSSALSLVAARSALDGRVVLPSREDLVASLAPPSDAALRDRLTATASARQRRLRVEGRVGPGREALRLWRRALDRAPDGPADLGPETAAVLVVSLADVLVRDEVLTWALDDGDALLALLLALAARSLPPHDVPVCTLVAWVAHARGDGGLANVALDRALAADPDYSMARICREALDAQVAPHAVRALLADARTMLHQQHPWTTSRSSRTAGEENGPVASAG